MAKVAYVVVEHDPDPDFSWLEQDHYQGWSTKYQPIYRTAADREADRPIDPDWYCDPHNHVALMVTAYDENDEAVADLSGIDFLADSDDWRIGVFHRLSRMPEGYLRDVAREMGLGE